MTPVVRADEQHVQQFIYQRLIEDFRVPSVIALSVQRFGPEFSATVWAGQEITGEMIEHVSSIEAELRESGVFCRISLKTDKDLPFGGKYPRFAPTSDFSSVKAW